MEFCYKMSKEPENATQIIPKFRFKSGSNLQSPVLAQTNLNSIISQTFLFSTSVFAFSIGHNCTISVQTSQTEITFIYEAISKLILHAKLHFIEFASHTHKRGEIPERHYDVHTSAMAAMTFNKTISTIRITTRRTTTTTSIILAELLFLNLSNNKDYKRTGNLKRPNFRFHLLFSNFSFLHLFYTHWSSVGHCCCFCLLFIACYANRAFLNPLNSLNMYVCVCVCICISIQFLMQTIV